MIELVKKIRLFLKDNQIDYLLINSTNEFLVEYSDLSENARYFVTNFTGSTGDALISQKDIFLFVDGRYHEQADLEVDKNLVTVVKMKIGESISKEIGKKIKAKKTLGIASKKISQGRLEVIESELKTKETKIKLLDFDPVMKYIEDKTKNKINRIEQVDVKIAGLSSDEKFKKISERLNDGEAILVTNLEEVSYLCNLRDFSQNYSSKIKGKCFIAKDFWWKCPANCNLKDYLKKLARINKIFVDKTLINAYDYNLLGEKAYSLKENFVKEMKSVKTKSEIEHYQECFKRTDEALLATRKFIEENENLSEYDIAKKLEEKFYEFGAKSLSFKSIVAKDKNAALAHYSKISEDEILDEGSLLLIDCGAYYEGGYATDITRVFVKGTPSDLQKTVYTAVLKSFLKAFNKKISKTTSGFSLDKIARELLNKIKPEDFEFSHSLGHGIGISVHESPPSLAFSPTAKVPLRPNMCFTIEPGLYNPKQFGVRLENSCYLSENRGDLEIKSFSSMCFEKKLIDFSVLTQTEKKQLKHFEVK